jgi:ribosomal protein S18 acetylase RimI-like enzyme
MTITLQPMAAAALPAWIAASVHEYELSRRGLGESDGEAAAHARQAAAMFFPGGAPAPGHMIQDVVLTGEGTLPQTIGYVWFAPRGPASDAWWVFDIRIYEAHRGSGYGRLALQQAELMALEHGAATMGLNVLGDNTVARHLYESLGYDTTTLAMRKELGTALP